MTYPNDKDIEHRAYQLWEDAGQPKGGIRNFILKKSGNCWKSASATNSRRLITFSRPAAAQYGTKCLRAD
jgi:Protein of unknown function (DUF2934)